MSGKTAKEREDSFKSGRPPMGSGSGSGHLDSRSEKSLVTTGGGGLLQGSGGGSGASFRAFKTVSSELCRSGYLRSLCWLLCHERECIRLAAGK